MKPANGKVFVEKVEKSLSTFDVYGQPRYRVTDIGVDVTDVKVGNFILFETYHEYKFGNETIIKVNVEDIDGICTEK